MAALKVLREASASRSNASPPYTAPVAGRCQLECDELFPEWLQNAGLPAGQAKALEALAEARAALPEWGEDKTHREMGGRGLLSMWQQELSKRL